MQNIEFLKKAIKKTTLKRNPSHLNFSASILLFAGIVLIVEKQLAFDCVIRFGRIERIKWLKSAHVSMGLHSFDFLSKFIKY
jgi:hypothetical protein